ncbi:Uncharacterized conserved protein, DUF2132 family [Colwellia chukchiensis]|uniref:Uncharacterized conserved protein, DUF2132 family n=1 Tax=Colwellia chukchiensis TaxID=641665 RepID=A0A1H7QAT2_9GAMM|nr:VF530 family DNA-binding protein [Colwellia chukchiensis]SEL44939.1 Uncharacterized conserved protein, DUF2132 family [Colwellia chukchiensis]
MNQQDIQLNNPLHGLKLETLLSEVVSHYGFDILAEYTRIKCFKNNPSMASSLKFLRKTQWARETLERFYLYTFKNLPEPSEDEFEIPPRQRIIPLHVSAKEPKVLLKGQAMIPVTKASFKETHRTDNRTKKSAYGSANKGKKSAERAKPSENKAQKNHDNDPYANAPR